MNICKNYTDAALIETTKRDGKLIDTHKYNCCSEILKMKCSYGIKQKKNQKSSDGSTRASSSAFSTSASANKINELLTSICLIYLCKN